MIQFMLKLVPGDACDIKLILNEGRD